jgi:outer membrane protein OmpA-like peptidoglycan-associated protein
VRFALPAAPTLLGAALIVASCAEAPPPSVVVLLPDPDGKVGRVTVANEGGSRTLDQAGTATRVAGGQAPPTQPAPLTAAEVDALFGAALRAQPAPPLHFILYFENDSTKLTAASRDAFPAVVAAIRERGSADTSVVGHSDTAGDARKNRELSLARAKSVAALLAAEGVDPATLEITSHGEANPLVPTGDNVSEPRNRRVEVTVR